MSKIIYKTHVSLNGLIEMPGSPPDWVIADEELFRCSNNLERQVGGYLWGRGMYENNMALWATADIQSMDAFVIEYSEISKQIPTIVFSSTLERVEGNARLERGGQAEAGGNAYVPHGDRLPALPTLAAPPSSYLFSWQERK